MSFYSIEIIKKWKSKGVHHYKLLVDRQVRYFKCNEGEATSFVEFRYRNYKTFEAETLGRVTDAELYEFLKMQYDTEKEFEDDMIGNMYEIY